MNVVEKKEVDIYECVATNRFAEFKDKINAGYNVNSWDSNYNYPIFLHAIYSNKFEFVDFLLKNGADINIRGKFNINALMIAAGKNNINIANYLIEKGVHINDTNEFNNTALMYSVNMNSGANIIIDILLAHDANPTLKNDAGNTILEIASENSLKHLSTYNVQDFILSKYPILYKNFKNKNILNKNIEKKYSHLDEMIDLNLL